jgi:hypothetical protein
VDPRLTRPPPLMAHLIHNLLHLLIPSPAPVAFHYRQVSLPLVPLNISASLKLLRHIKGHNKTQLSLWRSESKHYLKFQNHTAILSWASDSISWSSPSGSNGNLLEHAVSCHASTATSLTYLYFSLVYVNIQRLHCNTSICANFVL